MIKYEHPVKRDSTGTEEYLNLFIYCRQQKRKVCHMMRDLNDCKKIICDFKFAAIFHLFLSFLITGTHWNSEMKS